MNDKHIIHRGQWEGQPMPNSFESFTLYQTGVEADVILLNVSLQEFSALKVKGSNELLF